MSEWWTCIEAKDSLSSDIIQKIRYAVAVIAHAAQVYGTRGLSMSLNGGKDSTVLLHLLRGALAPAGPSNWARPSEEEMQKLIESNPTLFSGAKPRESSPEPSALSSSVPCASSLLSDVVLFHFKMAGCFPQEEEFMQSLSERYQFPIALVEMKDFKEALAYLLHEHPRISAVFLGTRRSDPHGAKLGFFSPTDPGWPPVMRVNPILEWNYHDIWTFLRAFQLPYCPLYDQGYTSLGYVDDTFPNPSLKQEDGLFAPAYMLQDESLERAGRVKRSKPAATPAPSSTPEDSK